MVLIQFYDKKRLDYEVGTFFKFCSCSFRRLAEDEAKHDF